MAQSNISTYALIKVNIKTLWTTLTVINKDIATPANVVIVPLLLNLNTSLANRKLFIQEHITWRISSTPYVKTTTTKIHSVLKGFSGNFVVTTNVNNAKKTK